MEIEKEIRLLEQEAEELRGFDVHYWKKKREKIMKRLKKLKATQIKRKENKK